jgi:anionic cell wall polymer biosynthesis LytR-Cps2A-Psr (LCP) family protein
VGGVPIDVEKNLDYDDNAGHLHIHLKQGFQVLNGYNAMCYVRFRHGDDDLQRQARQKKFLVAFKQQVVHDWLNLPSIVNEGVKVLGGALNNDEIASIAGFAKQVPPQSINWGQVPVTSRRGSGNLFLDKKNLQATLVQYKLVPPNGDSTTTANATSGGSDQ